MDQAVTVAVVRGDNRRGAVAQALSLLVAEVARCVSPDVLMLPSLARPGEDGLLDPLRDPLGDPRRRPRRGRQ